MGPPTRRRSVTGRVGVAMAGASPEPFHYILSFVFGRGDFIGLARAGAFSVTFLFSGEGRATQTAAGQPRTAEEIATFGVPPNRSSSVVLSSGGRCELGGFALQVGCYDATAPVSPETWAISGDFRGGSLGRCVLVGPGMFATRAVQLDCTKFEAM